MISKDYIPTTNVEAAKSLATAMFVGDDIFKYYNRKIADSLKGTLDKKKEDMLTLVVRGLDYYVEKYIQQEGVCVESTLENIDNELKRYHGFIMPLNGDRKKLLENLSTTESTAKKNFEGCKNISDIYTKLIGYHRDEKNGLLKTGFIREMIKVIAEKINHHDASNKIGIDYSTQLDFLTFDLRRKILKGSYFYNPALTRAK